MLDWVVEVIHPPAQVDWCDARPADIRVLTCLIKSPSVFSPPSLNMPPETAGTPSPAFMLLLSE